MQLALGLAAVLIGADLAISGVTKRSFTRLLMGNWDAPGSTSSTASTGAGAKAPATAVTGGAHAPGAPTNPVGFGATTPVGFR